MKDNIKMLKTVLMIVGFIFSIIFDAINLFIDKQVEIIKCAAFTDIENFKDKHPAATFALQKIGIPIPKDKFRINESMKKSLMI